MDDDLVPPSMPGQVQLSKKQSFFKKLFSKNESHQEVSLEKSVNISDDIKNSMQNNSSPLNMQAPVKGNPISQMDFSTHHDEIDLDKLRQHLGLAEDTTKRSSSEFDHNFDASSFEPQAPSPVKKSMNDFFVKGDDAGELKVDYSPVQATVAPKKPYTSFEFDSKKLGIEEPSKMSKTSFDADTTYFTNAKTYEPKVDALAKKSGALNFSSSIEDISHDEIDSHDQEMAKNAWDQFDWTRQDSSVDDEIQQASDLAKDKFTDDLDTDPRVNLKKKETGFTSEIPKDDVNEMKYKYEDGSSKLFVTPIPLKVETKKEKEIDPVLSNLKDSQDKNDFTKFEKTESVLATPKIEEHKDISEISAHSKNLFQLSNGEIRLVKTDLKKEVEKLKKDRQELEHQKITIAGNMQKLNVKEKQIDKEKAMLEEDKKDLTSQIANFEMKKREGQDIVQKFPSLKREYAAVQQELEELKKTLKRNQDKLIGLESDIRILEKQKSQKEESFAQRESVIDEKIAFNKRLEENLAKRERALEEAQNTLQGMESTIRQTGFSNYLGQELNQKTVVVPTLDGKQDLKKNPHEEAFVLVNQCRNQINQNKIKEAKQTYVKAWEEYNKLLESGAENEELYRLVRELYDDLTGSELL